MNLNELEGLGGDAGFQVDYENVPDQPGGFTPPPPPGTYGFKLPGDLSSIWEAFEVEVNGTKTKRLRAIFEGSTSLTITQSKTGDQNEESFRSRISNAERKRNKEGLMASDMLYLLRALGDDGQYKTNIEYAEALQKHPGAEFIADVEWSAWCADNKPIRALETDGSVSIVESQNGCGERVYQRDIPKEEGLYAEQFSCSSCGALLRAFPNLQRFRTVTASK